MDWFGYKVTFYSDFSEKDETEYGVAQGEDLNAVMDHIIDTYGLKEISDISLHWLDEYPCCTTHMFKKVSDWEESGVWEG